MNKGGGYFYKIEVIFEECREAETPKNKPEQIEKTSKKTTRKNHGEPYKSNG